MEVLFLSQVKVRAYSPCMAGQGPVPWDLGLSDLLCHPWYYTPPQGQSLLTITTSQRGREGQAASY